MKAIGVVVAGELQAVVTGRVSNVEHGVEIGAEGVDVDVGGVVEVDEEDRVGTGAASALSVGGLHRRIVVAQREGRARHFDLTFIADEDRVVTGIRLGTHGIGVAIRVVAIRITVEVIVHAIVAVHLDIGSIAGREPGAVGVLAIHELVAVVVFAVPTELGDTSVAHRIAAAVEEVRAVHESVAVVVDLVVADLIARGNAAGVVTPAIPQVVAICIPVAIIVDVVIADLAARRLAATNVGTASSIITVGESVTVVVGAIITELGRPRADPGVGIVAISTSTLDGCEVVPVEVHGRACATPLFLEADRDDAIGPTGTGSVAFDTSTVDFAAFFTIAEEAVVAKPVTGDVGAGVERFVTAILGAIEAVGASHGGAGYAEPCRCITELGAIAVEPVVALSIGAATLSHATKDAIAPLTGATEAVVGDEGAALEVIDAGIDGAVDAVVT